MLDPILDHFWGTFLEFLKKRTIMLGKITFGRAPSLRRELDQIGSPLCAVLGIMSAAAQRMPCESYLVNAITLGDPTY